MAGDRDYREKDAGLADDGRGGVPEAAGNNLLWATHLLARRTGLDHLRFRSNPGLSFVPKEVERIRPVSENGETGYELSVNVGGLDGISGPLPLWLNEILSREDTDEPDGAPVGDFLNIFSHRFIESLYLAWADKSPSLAYERKGKDRISEILFCLLGIHFPGSRTEEEEADDFRRARLLPYIGTMGQRCRSAAGLQGMLRDYFEGVPLSVAQFVLRRVTIPENEQARLGQVGMTLGQDFVAGEQVEDIAGAFRIKAGPLDFSGFSDFLPGGRHYRHLSRLVKMYVSHLLAWDLGLRITGDSVPPMRLGKEEDGLRLGRSTWMRTAWYEVTPRVQKMLLGIGVSPEQIRNLSPEYDCGKDFVRAMARLVPPKVALAAAPAILRAAYRIAPKEDDEIIFNPEA